MARATKGPVVKSIPPTARTAHSDSLTAQSLGILRIMNRPAQWVVIITLLISWSIAGVIMFDFVSDNQIASIQDFGSDPVLAVSKAIEGIEKRINHMNDMLYDAIEYATEIIFNPRDAISLAADSSVSYLSGIFSADGDSGVTETVKYAGTVLDEATEWIRTPVSYFFHLFEDILAIAITPVDMITEVAVQILSGIKTIIQYISAMFGGIEGITETVKLGGTVLDEVTEWIRFPVGYLFHLFEDILDVAIIYPGDIATEAVLQILSRIKTISSAIFGYIEAWFPKLSTDPEGLAVIVVEEATDIKTTVSNYLTSLITVDEGGIPDISFDPMKVVTDTVEEFADRRDMFMAYLFNMEDKGDTPQVIRRKGEFLPPIEKVLEQVKEAKEKKAREEIYKIIQDMREKEAEGKEEEITLQQINITVEKVKKEKKIEKAKRKEKSKEDETREPAEKDTKKTTEKKVKVTKVDQEAPIKKKKSELKMAKKETKPAQSKKEPRVTKEKAKPARSKKVAVEKPKLAPGKKEPKVSKEKAKLKPSKKAEEKQRPVPVKKKALAPKDKIKPALLKKEEKPTTTTVKKEPAVAKEKVKPVPSKKDTEATKDKVKPAPVKKEPAVSKGKAKAKSSKKEAEVAKDKHKPVAVKKETAVAVKKAKPKAEPKKVTKEKAKAEPAKKEPEITKGKLRAPKKEAKVIKVETKPAPAKKEAKVIKGVKPAPKKKEPEVIKKKVKLAPVKKKHGSC
ncbi:triadin-like isoform X5 [Carassius auratus]|uniref:Triadin-like isoform X5 n=1 Tax=Carassius auratus TaxID=7957 RepID=A0A6P6LM41_CARAU|nr:triadin-like isoform X5 [Carassius auratus]XP_026085629.1 triadin-like isoform X5 [Carassius auratus]